MREAKAQKLSQRTSTVDAASSSSSKEGVWSASFAAEDSAIDVIDSGPDDCDDG